MTAYGNAQREIVHPIDFLYQLQSWQDNAALLMLAEKPVVAVIRDMTAPRVAARVFIGNFVGYFD